MKDISPSGAANLWAVVAMLPLATISIVLRFALKFHAKLQIIWSDKLILLSLLLLFAYSGLIIHCESSQTPNSSENTSADRKTDIIYVPGPGTFDLKEIAANIENGGLVWGKELLKTLYIADNIFGVAITSIKLSILAFYHNVFSISKEFRRYNYIIGALCLVWLIVTFFMNLFQCHPISALWEALGSTEFCLPSGILWLSFEITNLFLDVCVLALPLPLIRRLHLRPAQKWSVATIFLLGGLVCFVSIARLAFIWDPKSPEVVSNIPNTLAMAAIQLGTAVFCACLPTYAPLLKPLGAGVRKVKRAFGVATSKSRSISYGSRSRNRLATDSTNPDIADLPYLRMDGQEAQNTTVSGAGDEALPLEELPSHSIMVQKTVNVI